VKHRAHPGAQLGGRETLDLVVGDHLPDRLNRSHEWREVGNDRIPPEDTFESSARDQRPALNHAYRLERSGPVAASARRRCVREIGVDLA